MNASHIVDKLLETEYRHPEYSEQEKPDDFDSGEAPPVNLDDPSTFIKQEIARRADVKKIEICGRNWWRRGAGGNYCRAYIYINDKLVHTTPVMGGSSEHYLQMATDWLRSCTGASGLTQPISQALSLI